MTKKEALAQYLEVEVDEIEDGYDDDHFEYDNEEYAVYTDDEADDATYNDIDNLFDDIGLESFTPSFQEWILNNALESDWFEDALQESEQYYVDDMDDDEVVENALDEGIIDEDDCYYEEDDEYKEYPKYEDIDNLREQLVERLVDNAGDPIEWYKWNFGFGSDFAKMLKNGNGPSVDMDMIVDECISQDGRGHFLSYYDGTELELEDGYYAYRQN